MASVHSHKTLTKTLSKITLVGPLLGPLTSPLWSSHRFTELGLTKVLRLLPDFPTVTEGQASW